MSSLRAIRRISQRTRCLHTSPPLRNTTPPHTSPKSNTFRNISLGVALGLSAYTLGAIFPPPPLTLAFPRPAPGPPPPDSPSAKAYVTALERELQALPALENARKQDEEKREWYECRPYTDFPEERRVNNLTAGALSGVGRLAIRPLVRARKDESEAIAFVHVGRGLCGHDGIVHGGLLATLLDEALARTAINNLPEKVGMTVSLTLAYRAPTKADQFIRIRTVLTEHKGRKASVSGTIEDLEGRVLVEASAVFVQPKFAGLLNKSAVKSAMGQQPQA